MTRNSRRLQKAVQAIFNDYREKASCPGQVYQNAACGCDNALQMWRGPKGEKGDQGPQGPKGDNAGSFLVDAEFVVDPEGQEPGAYLKLVLIDVAQQEQVVYVDLSYLTDIYEGGNGISIVDMVVAARLGAGLTFDANGNIASAYQFCDGLDETSNVVKVRLDSSNRILGFASGTCGGLTATVGLAPSATGVNLVLTGAGGAVLSTIPLEGGTGITVQKNAQTGGFTWLADPAGMVSSQTGNQLSVSQTDNKLYVGGNTLEYTFGTGAFTLKDSSGATLSSVTVPSAVRMLEDMELRTDDGIYLHLTYLRDNGLHAYQDVSLDELLCNNVDTADDTAAAYSKAVPSGNWQTASINEVGGRTVVWNQLVQDYYNCTGGTASYDATEQTVTYTVSTPSTTNGTRINYLCGSDKTEDSHKYLISVDVLAPHAIEQLFFYRITTTTNHKFNQFDGVNTANAWTTMTRIYTGSDTGLPLSYAQIMIYNSTRDGFVAGDVVKFRNFVWLDLTLMFGAGNEPTTVAEFEAMFPSIDPAYNAGELKSAGVTEAVSKYKTVVWNQLITNGDFSEGTTGWGKGGGVSSFSVANNAATLVFATGQFYNHYIGKNSVSMTNGHKYYITGTFQSSTIMQAFIQTSRNTRQVNVTGTKPVGKISSIFNNSQDTGNTSIFFRFADVTLSEEGTGTLSDCYLIDLTQMFGEGNEPATVSEFEAMFPSLDPAYNAGTEISYNIAHNQGIAAALEVGSTLATLPIPSAIQALPGYGWSAGSAYNVVSLAQGKNSQKVGEIDLGAETTIWFYNAAQQFFSTQLSNASNTTTNAIVQGYTLKSAQTGWANMKDFEFGIVNGSLRLHNSAYTSSAAFKTTLQGKKAYYELATPIETDISSLLTDNTIEVEAGGTLTFKNQHGDDFRLPVPNSETFIYEHPWVFEDCVKDAMQPAIDALNARIDDVSVELTLDAHCEDVVTPATAEPFDDYILSGSINTLLLEPDGTISDLKHSNAIPDSSAARGSVTMELFNPESTDGLSIELYAKQSSGSDSQNYYSNITPDAEDPQKCATLADFLAAGEQGLPLTYADETSFSGVTPFAENETLYASVVSNGNNSYTFTFTVRTSEVKETQLILDLVSGENRTDLKPLLEHVGGKVDMVAVPSGDAVQLSFGYAGAGYIFGSRRSDFPTVGLFANSAEDICTQTNLIQPTTVAPGANDFSYYFDTLPTHFAIPVITEVDATGLQVGTTAYAPPMMDMETMRCTGEGTALADIPEVGLVYTEYDTSSRPFVPTGRTLRLRATVGNAGIVFTLWQQETVDKPMLCLEPSCDSCIDLSPVMDAVDEKIAPVQEQVTQNASDIAALQTVVEGITTDYTYALGAAVSAYYDTRRTGKVYQVKFPTWDTAHTVAGEKLLDNAGLVCVPSTDTVEGQDDYADIPMFQWVNVNYARNADGSPYPTAIEGSNAYKTTGSVDVGAMQMSFYYRVHVENGYQYWTVSDSPHPELNLVPWPECVKADGTVLPWCIGSKYMAGRAPDGTPRSLPGLDLWNRDMSYNNAVTYFHRKGAGYQGAGMEAGLFNLLFMVIKYATKNLNTIMYGCLYYTYYGYIALAETDATRILLPANDAWFLPNTYIQSGTSTVANRDRGYADAYDVCDHAKILSVEQVTVGGTTYTALNIDKTVTTTLGGVVITTPFNAGATDSVLGHHDGSPVDNNSGHWPCRVQGREQFVGAWCLSCDVALNTVTSLDQEIWWAPKGVTRSTNTTVIQDTYRNIGTAIGNSGTSFWIGDIDVYNGEGLWVPSKVGQSNSTGWCDYRWVSTGVGWREHLWGGALYNGTYCGPVGWAADRALSYAGWYYAARD